MCSTRQQLGREEAQEEEEIFVDVKEDPGDDDDGCYEDAREEIMGFLQVAGCERVSSCNAEVKDQCSGRKGNNPPPSSHLFYFLSPVPPFSTLSPHAAASLPHDSSSLSRIPHHTSPHTEHRVPQSDFLSFVFMVVVTNKEQRCV